MTTERLDQPGTGRHNAMTPIIVNGAERHVRQGSSLQDLAIALGIAAEPRGVAMALDGLVVPRNRWDATVLAVGARVEVVRAGAGG